MPKRGGAQVSGCRSGLIAPQSAPCKARRVAVGLIVGIVVLFAASPASAYRPFDGTDAAVADLGEVEIEFQPIGAIRAVTGAFVDELPFGATTTALGFGAPSGKAQSILVPTVETLHWGLSIQYSTYYLTSRFTGGPPKDEPLNQLLPLVEFSFDTPRGQNTVATMNPGLAYVAVAWQLAAEVVVPLNRDAGSATGFRAQLLLFLDDLVPKLFNKPLLSDKPDRSLIAWH